jgi:hypothetical protein
MFPQVRGSKLRGVYAELVKLLITNKEENELHILSLLLCYVYLHGLS